MPRSMFNRIHEKLLGKNLFIHRVDHSQGIISIVVMNICSFPETAARDSMKAFSKLMVQEFGPLLI
jgi:hypothetical protein